MCRQRKRTWFGRLMDKDDKSTAMSNFIIFFVLIIAGILLLLPVYALGIEVWYNHLNSGDMTGWAAYIGSVTTLIMSVCGLKWGINYTDRKYPIDDPYDGPQRPFCNSSQEEEIITENQE